MNPKPFTSRLRPRPAVAAAGGLPAELLPLAGIDGLDLAGGLRQCGSRSPMYLHMLDRFAELYAPGLMRPAAPGDAPDLVLRDAAHSLRGAAATIGAVRVQALAAELEGLCAGPSALEARAASHAAVCAALAPLVQRLRQRLHA